MPTGTLEKVVFVESTTDGPLHGIVGSLVGYQMSGQQPTLHRGVPSPSLTFIINLETPIVTGTHARANDDGSATAHDNVLSGLHTHAAYVFQPDRQAGLQLAVHPLATRRLFGVPASELVETSHEAADVIGDGIRRVQEQLAEEASWQRRFETVERYLVDRASAAPSFGAPRTEVVAAWRWMVAHRGNGRMDDLARHVLLSTRQLTKLFRAELGVPPKVVNRLIRFDRARQTIQAAVLQGRRPALSEVAHACGYYDHAHLVRDFQAFLGCSPTTWLAEEGRNIQAGGHHHGEGLTA
jgi:AraC-like DNA-binding protein